MTARIRLDEFLPYRLAYTANLVSEAVARSYKALFDLTIPEWRVIAHVAEGVPATQQDVVSRSRMDKVTVSRATLALVDRGVIGREPNVADRRSRLLVLTAAGERLYAEIAPKALELERTIFGLFSAAEKAELKAVLSRIDQATLDAERRAQGH